MALLYNVLKQKVRTMEDYTGFLRLRKLGVGGGDKGDYSHVKILYWEGCSGSRGGKAKNDNIRSH